MTQAKVSPEEAARNFARYTRKHYQPLASIAGAENARVSFTLPKSRFLNRVRFMVAANLNVQHLANNTYTPATFAPYSLLRNINIKINNGFTPYNISGTGAYFCMLPSVRPDMILPYLDTDVNTLASRRRAVQGITAAPAPGTDNPVRFVVDLPVTLNDRDPVGLVLLQHEPTQVTVTIDIGTANDIAPTAAGYTFSLTNIVITPMVETFSIPEVPKSQPDISIVKLVQEQNEAIPGAGRYTVKMVPGNTYRKIFLYLTDASGGVADAAIAGDFQLVLNSTDIMYELPPRMLAAINQEQYGITLPQGLFVFDFTYQGLPNYGGARDYVDSGELAEFWLHIPAPAAGNAKIITETVTKMLA
jgi:hypothetical protein